MPSLHDTAPVFAALLVGLVISVLVVGPPTPTDAVSPEEPPDEEIEVTCYKWVENGTAAVYCPNKVYAPDAVVNITVKECSEYVVQIDEPPPCDRDGDPRGIAA